MVYKDELETMVDVEGLTYILELLAGICDEKAARAAVKEQDTTLAKAWQADAVTIGLTAKCICSDT